jgi:hypothetical protein
MSRYWFKIRFQAYEPTEEVKVLARDSPRNESERIY